MEINEKILFQRGNTSKEATNLGKINPYLTKPSDLLREDNLGVLVIDPNKVVNKYNEIVDRYVKQEDLVMYASLKVFKREQSAVVYNETTGVKQKENISTPININFINPLSNKRDSNGNFINKNKLTNEWTDFFTKDSSNDPNSSDYVFDPESFGISNISVKINANHLPIIEIEFIDIQGRMLFERGNDKNNPYNIFYSYPYPTFILKYKGYYGKATETKMVLLQTNTRFDPSSGNYVITAKFQGELFAFFNTFLLIYGYVAPYMFKTDDGDYLGGKILKSLYDKQNDEIRSLVGEELYDKYKIETSPTLYDLSRSILNIPIDTLTQSLGGDGVTNNNILLEKKILIESYDVSIKDFITKNRDNYKEGREVITNSGVLVYEPVSSEYNIDLDEEKPTTLLRYIDTLNDAINEIAQIKLPNNQTNTFYTDVIQDITKNEKVKKYSTTNKINKNELINANMFIYNESNVSGLYLDVFNTIMLAISNAIGKIQTILEEDYINDQIKDFGVKLGYEPNFNNILRILSNNMQTFLILLEVIGISSIKQLESNRDRVRKHMKSTDYKVDFGQNILTPFPNYYEVENDYVDGKSIDKKVLAYPGKDPSNSEWFEVAFIDEIYSAVDRVKQMSNPNAIGFKEQIPTSLLTLFQLGENKLTSYNVKDYGTILAELINKYSIYASYSGLLYRGLNGLSSNITPKLADIEFDLMLKNVFGDIKSQNRVTIASELAIVTKSEVINGVNYSNLANFGVRFIGFGDKTVDTTINTLKPYYNELTNLVNNTYSEVEFNSGIVKFNNVIASNIKINNVYDRLTFKKSDSDINLYSNNSVRKSDVLKHLVDLRPNFSYNCNNASILLDLGNDFTSLDGTKSNSNIYQGLYENMNTNLSKIPVNTDLNRGVSYAQLNNTPALTFNSLSGDYLEMGELSGYKPAKPSGNIKHHIIFNKL